MPSRIQRRRTKGWRIPKDAVNVTRGTDWGNPYRVGDRVAMLDSTFGDMPLHDVVITRQLAVDLFRAYVTERGWHRQIAAELGGKDLVCWCPLDQPCHADVLLEIANAEVAA